MPSLLAVIVLSWSVWTVWSSPYILCMYILGDPSHSSFVESRRACPGSGEGRTGPRESPYIHIMYHTYYTPSQSHQSVTITREVAMICMILYGMDGTIWYGMVQVPATDLTLFSLALSPRRGILGPR